MDIFEAIERRNLNQVQTLIAAGIDLEQYESETDLSPLAKAIQLRFSEAIEILLNAGADSNQLVCFCEYTPLTLAVKNSDVESVELLLRSGASLQMAGTEGSSLRIAAESGNDIMLKTILALETTSGLNVDKNDVPDIRNFTTDEIIEMSKQVSTPLMGAANNGHLNTVQTLIQAGANPDLTDENDETALCKAARHGHEEIFRFLLPLTREPEQRKYAIQLINQYLELKRKRRLQGWIT
jgi:uncharacterized protein